MSTIIAKTALDRLADGWIAAGKTVAGPAATPAGRVVYQPVEKASQLKWTGFLRPVNSIKEFVFPRHETLYSYKMNGKQIELVDQPLPTKETIVLGARPCDAAALTILDGVFNWDYKDQFFDARRAQTTVVVLACNEHDDHCFCTSVGLGPDHPQGADAMLYDLGDGSYEVRCLTPKGEKLFAGQTQTSEKVGKIGPGPEPKPYKEIVEKFFAGGFENPEWQSMTMRCLGCGACAFTCPTCHCFDIADEGNPQQGGRRVRNWDACQFTLYSLHASGHNPRNNQGQRQRQRVYHKFQTYPQKFGQTLCTGCGNCTRNCPVDLGVRPVIETMESSVARGR